MNDNTKTKYLIIESEESINTSNISFTPTITNSQSYINNNSNQYYFGGLEVTNTGNFILTGSLFENHALSDLSGMQD
ncbi:hypothetical protein J6W34_06745 [bacterium]|nr:hypothetical protein [bacterium]